MEIKFEKLDDDDQRQDMILHKGCRLISIDSFNLEDIFIDNCDEFVVEKLNKTSVVLKDLNDENIIELSYKDVKKYLVLNYAITINRAQGLTIEEPYSIWEWNHQYMSNKKRYTAYSRCRDESLIHIYS